MSEQVAREGFKLDPARHSPDCWNRDEQTFVVYRGFQHRTKNGRRGGSTWWHAFACNDADCPALMLVRWDVLADFLRGGPRP